MLVQGCVHVFFWQCCMLCHIVFLVIVMLVCFCVCCFCLCCCHLLCIWAWLWTLLLLALNNMIVGFACFHWNMLVLVVSIFVFGVVAVFVVRRLFVVTVNRVFIFFGDGHGHSQADSRLPCRIRVCARVEGVQFWLLVSLFLDSSHAFHGLDCLVFVVFLFCFIVFHSVAWVVVMLYESPRR